ncbi:tRNA (5-methylaminomethyl-2-thiouridine)(34)-methyltransferase MnmD [Anianabacter salinae]|uniref:tRNA (5-methylaminomethyl-2-thiouridine)(34)-methyltransferase MnmD n=1 Tax=Anianabacter salinae TaxID=2851023 RepID=UPI00225DE187|nr:tRNA (5-methylaminomethyl-2-thiouridine)(34)-methyltransferase MnmD [Anianabacter salinae]MBV0913281.1 tRNA (5-methylaminomethyl-2-thiouridine)(34)-methyltransferase MnmD [Anianabacter salinae]
MTGKAGLEWRDGTPVSHRFDDPYFSMQNGLEETRHVFLSGNGLPARFRDGFHIAELGFGTGLNLAVACMAWAEHGAPGRLRFTSFEAYPLAVPEMHRSLEVFPGTAKALAGVLNAIEAGATEALTDTLHFTLIPGDARQTLAHWDGAADAWFLDGFSPAKNPELWGPDLMRGVAARTAKGGTFATYTAAGHVRRALDAAGFDVARLPGYGRKRHMSAGTLRPPP